MQQPTARPPSSSQHCCNRPWVRYSLCALSILVIAGIMIALLILMPVIVVQLQFFFSWISANPSAGYFVYIFFDILMIVTFLPNTLFSLVAAFSFKQAIGFTQSLVFTALACYFSSMCGAILCFLLGRHCCRESIRRRVITKLKYLKALDNGIKTNGIRLVLLLRLAFFIPFTLISYALGTTAISLWEYAIGSLSMVVVLFFQVFLGCSILDISAIVQGNYTGSALYKSMIIGGILFTAVILIVLVFVTRHQLKKMEQRELKEENEDEPSSLLIPNQD